LATRRRPAAACTASLPPPLLLRAWRAKTAVTAAVLTYYLAGYFGLNRFPFGSFHAVPALPVLDELPFLLWTFPVYNSVFVLCALGIWLLPDAAAARGYLLSVLAAYTLNFACFALFPSAIERPPLPDTGSAWLWLARLTQAVDRPATCFPSLHIASVTVALLWHRGSPQGPWLLVWALAIAAATLTTKQHLFLDLPAGALVGLAGHAAAGRRRRRRGAGGGPGG
jgi:hypothetical protein